MRSQRSVGSVVIMCFFVLAFASFVPRLNGQSAAPSMRPAAESDKILGAFADAVASKAPAAALATFTSTYNATVTQGPKGPVGKHELTFLSSSTAADSADGSVMRAANCSDKCPSTATGYYKNKLGNAVAYQCSGLEGCFYDANLKKWKCTYRSCYFYREGTVIPQ
jgi:hypothetical protein